jgi:glycosyltransferase involved in cell wall biosynthesis
MIVVVTIVMPVYHPGKYLESLLTQTFGDFRLIAIDDGSMDGLFFACARFI